MVSDEEFDKKLDELGWSPSDIGTMAGMYMDRQVYKIEKAIKDWFLQSVGNTLSGGGFGH